MELFEEINKIIGKDYYNNNSEISLDFESLKIYSMYYKLPEDFIRKYYFGSDLIDLIIYNQILSESFIEEILNQGFQFAYEKIISNQKLSESFIEKHPEILQNWKNYISRHQILSWEFMEKHKDRLNWSLISSRQPFINFSRLEEIKEYSRFEFYLNKAYNENILYCKYKKDRNWFIGYIEEINLFNNIKEICLGVGNNLYSYNSKSDMIKVRIYWDDLITTHSAKKVYPIRKVKLI